MNKRVETSTGASTAGAAPECRPLTLAFYLPQFHQIPENDQWWGEGFTEWTNVARATPQYHGHYHPQVPATPFGEYSLLDPQVAEWQCTVAQAHDIDAFVYYHYWFSGKRLLETPLNMRLESEHPMPFAICWANENWTRRWDGKAHKVLIGQDYSETSPIEAFESFLPYLQDKRYLRVGGRAVLLVHRVDHLPNPKMFAEKWRVLAVEHGIGPLYLVASETFPGLDPTHFGFDAVAEFPPVGDSTLRVAMPRSPSGLARGFRGRLNSYPALARKYMRRNSPPHWPRHPTVIPRWDNTPRRGRDAAIFLNSSPDLYAEWLQHARATEGHTRGAAGIVFINAWNEWAEGAYLEPDSRFGSSYLEATRYDYEGPVATPPASVRLARRPYLRGIITALAHSTWSRLCPILSRLPLRRWNSPPK